MNPFEYVSLLTSIVLAHGITRIFTGIGKIVQLRRKIRPYWVHLLWASNVLLWLLLDGWILYRWRAYEGWPFFLFLFVLLSPIVAFLMAVLLFPDPLEEGTDLREYYYANHRGFFILAALLPPIDAIDMLSQGPGSLRRPGTALYLHVAGRLHIERDRRLDKARTIPCGVRRVLPALYARLHQHQSPRADLRRDRVSPCDACEGLAFPRSRHRGSPDVASGQGGDLRRPA